MEGFSVWHPPLGPPYILRHRPTVGSQGASVPNKRGTPEGVQCHAWHLQRDLPRAWALHLCGEVVGAGDGGPATYYASEGERMGAIERWGGGTPPSVSSDAVGECEGSARSARYACLSRIQCLKVVSQKSTPPNIRQPILDYS